MQSFIAGLHHFALFSVLGLFSLSPSHLKITERVVLIVYLHLWGWVGSSLTRNLQVEMSDTRRVTEDMSKYTITTVVTKDCLTVCCSVPRVHGQ